MATLEQCCDAMEDNPNNYDIIVTGKYGTGHAVIDCYRLFAAFEQQGKRLPAELEHSIKKIAFNGTRGAKDSIKDLTEARNQIDIYLQRLKDESN